MFEVQSQVIFPSSLVPKWKKVNGIEMLNVRHVFLSSSAAACLYGRT
jgi:hypothetical protein